RGNAVDDQELRAGRRAHALDQFDGQPMAVLLRPSPLIAAVVSSQHREFVDQIAFRSHDLDAIEAGLPGQHRAADVIRYRLLDLDYAHGARRKLVDARRNVGRTETFLLARIATGMQDLQADLAAMLVNRFGDALQFPRLRVLGEYRPTGLDQARGIRRVAAGDDQADLALGPFGEEDRHLVQPVLLHVEAGMHRAHDHPV